MPISTISQAGLDAPISLTSPTLTTPNIDSAQIPTVSGTAPLYMARAWVNFNGTTATPSTIRGSGNVTSVTKNSTGDYTVNFTTAMPDANYSFQGTGSQVANNGTLQPYTLATYLAGSVRCVFFDSAAYRDPAVVSVAIFR